MADKYTFLFPGLWMNVGGNIAQIKLMHAIGILRSVEAVTYKEATQGNRELADVLDEDQTFVVHWGPDVDGLIQRLKGRRVVYVAHSVGWRINLPVQVPILTVSRNTLAYWGRKAPNNFLAFLPNVVDLDLSTTSGIRDIDVLVQERKTSQYVLQTLVPKLREFGLRVEVQSGWTNDLYALMRRSKVYLYDSVEHWIRMKATEGFGLPPIEALSCGCTVFSSVNDALADYLDPGVNCFKLRVFSSDFDAANIARAVLGYGTNQTDVGALRVYSLTYVLERLRILLPQLERFSAATSGTESDIPAVAT